MRVVCLAMLIAWLGAPRPLFAEQEVRPRIAVLPGQRADVPPAERALDAAIRRVMTDRFVELHGVRVVAFETAARVDYPPESDSTRARSRALLSAGGTLTADVLVSISASPAGDRFRVRSFIAHMKDRSVRSGPSRTVAIDEVFPLLGDIAEAACERAGVSLAPEERERLARVSTSSGPAFTAFGLSLIMLPTGAGAEQKAREAIERDAEFVEARVQLGRIYYLKGDYELAAAAFEDARDLRLDHPFLDYNLGLTYRALGNYPQAIAAYERARATQPNDADIANNLGTVYYLAGDLDRAREAFRDALVLAPYDRRARANLAAVEQALAAPLLGSAAAKEETPAAAETATGSPPPPADREVPAEATSALQTDPQVYVDTGAIFYAQGEYERAVENYERAVAEHPDNVDALIGLGRAYQKLGRHQEAVGVFERALLLQPGSTDAATLADRSRAALRIAGRITTPSRTGSATHTGMSEIDLAQTYFRKGKRHFVRGEFDAAIGAYTRALQFTPDDAAILNSLGVVYFETDRRAEARDAFARALKAVPDDDTARRNLAALQQDQDRVRLAAADAAGALTTLRLDVDPALAPELAFLEGHQAYAEGDYATAIAAFERAVELKPNHAKAWNNLGVARVHVGEYAAASDAFARAGRLLDDPVVQANVQATRVLAAGERADRPLALDADPELHYRYRMAAARAAYERGDYAAAAQAYEEVAAAHPERGVAMNNLAAAYYMLGRTEDAHAAITLALDRAPASEVAAANSDVIAKARYIAVSGYTDEQVTAPHRLAEANVVLRYEDEAADEPVADAPPADAEAPGLIALLAEGDAAMTSGDADAALAAYQRALRVAPEELAATRGAARAYAARGEWATACEFFRRADRPELRDFSLLMTWGFAALRAERPSEARDVLARAVEVNPASAQAQYNLAIAERKLGHLEPAVAACNAAIAIDPTFLDARYNLANLLLELQRWERAIEAFLAVIELDAANVGAYNNLAIARWQLGQYDAAIRLWRQALALDPDCAYARENLNRFSRHAAAELAP